MAASADHLKETRDFVKKLGLSFQIGYDLQPKEFSEKTGAFYEATDGYIHATGFVLNPEGRVANAVYSTMAIGRLVAADCLGLVAYLRKSA